MDDTLADTSDFSDANCPEAQVARTQADADRLFVDPALLPLPEGVPDEVAINSPVPEVLATTEERFKDYAIDSITHVVVSVTISQQIDILGYVGYQYDWGRPGPCWHFLAKIVAKGVFHNKVELEELNYVAVRRREFIAYTTSIWRAVENAVDRSERPPLSVIEVNFKKPQLGQSLEITWAPARPLITAQVGELTHFSERSTLADLSNGDETRTQ